MPDEALNVVKDMTMHILTLGVGVFALVGGYLSSQDHKDLHGKRTLLFSLLLFGLSVFAGLIVLMNLANLAIHTPVGKQVDLLGDILRWSSAAQIILAGGGAAFFFIYLSMNLWRRK